MTDVSHLPTPGIVLDLDIEERDPEDVKPPFIVNVEGRTITFADPSEIDWKLLAGIEVPADLFAVALQKDDRKHLRTVNLPGWKFNRLMEAYYSHYDLEDKIRAAKRQAQF